MVNPIPFFTVKKENSTKNEITTYFILMEFGPNGTLGDLIRKNSNEKNILSTNVIYAFIYQLSKGLKALHNNNYYHQHKIQTF